MDDLVAAAANVLRGGGIVALPTDTVYGIAALPHLAGATARLFAAKRRTADVPIAVLCADRRQALALADDPGEEVQRLAARLWPGPLTIVLPRRDGLGFHLGEPAATIGVRCPDHELVRALTAAIGPIATTSANRHGHPTPTTGEAVAAELGDDIDLVIDGGVCAAPPSTVVDATTAAWHVLREGAIDLAALRAAAIA